MHPSFDDKAPSLEQKTSSLWGCQIFCHCFGVGSETQWGLMVLQGWIMLKWGDTCSWKNVGKCEGLRTFQNMNFADSHKRSQVTNTWISRRTDGLYQVELEGVPGYTGTHESYVKFAGRSPPCWTCSIGLVGIRVPASPSKGVLGSWKVGLLPTLLPSAFSPCFMMLHRRWWPNITFKDIRNKSSFQLKF